MSCYRPTFGIYHRICYRQMLTLLKERWRRCLRCWLGHPLCQCKQREASVLGWKMQHYPCQDRSSTVTICDDRSSLCCLAKRNGGGSSSVLRLCLLSSEMPAKKKNLIIFYSLTFFQPDKLLKMLYNPEFRVLYWTESNRCPTFFILSSCFHLQPSNPKGREEGTVTVWGSTISPGASGFL